MSKREPNPNHMHLAYFGSELGCEICNPVCWKNHEYGNPNMLQWCGNPDCPMNPERFKQKTYPVEFNQELVDYLTTSPREGEKQDLENAMKALKTEECKPFIPTLGEKLDWEKEEDEIRKLKRKSIRKGGKYKERGKEKRREP